MKAFICASIDEVRQGVAAARSRHLSIGLVPTMGALHAGHASLMKAARAETGFVVVSIFVNPTQFGPAEDFANYPQQLEQDRGVCGREGVDIVFAPALETMYPSSFQTYVEVERISEGLCGTSRPGHFRGVATVVTKLLNIVQPEVAYFGQKDAQQVRVIEQLVRDLNLPVRIRVCPIVREPDGLALSSRNKYLEPEQRRAATILFRTLEEVRQQVLVGETDAVRLRRLMTARIEAAPGAVVDYVALVDAVTLAPVDRLRGDVLAAVAVRFGSTRLIDNVVLTVE